MNTDTFMFIHINTHTHTHVGVEIDAVPVRALAALTQYAHVTSMES